MSEAHPIQPDPAALDLLLEEASWLRRLSLHLVQDPGLADDVVQETWIAALRSAPNAEIASDAARRRGWLATVARRAAGRNRVRDRNREDREELVSADRSHGDVPRPDEVRERMETQSEVAQAVMGLAEPHRTTLYLLYYEGRSAVDIASSLGVPVSTVRSRAYKGRKALRAALTREERSWDDWVLALTPWVAMGQSTTVVSTGGAGWLGGKWTAQVAAFAGVVLGLGIAWWALSPANQERQAREDSAAVMAGVGATAEAAATVNPATPEADSRAGATGRATVLAEPKAPTKDALAPVLVYGSVVDAGGEPIGGAYLHFECEAGVHRVRSDAEDGSWALPSLHAGDWSVVVAEQAHQARYETLSVPSQGPFEQTFELARKQRVPVRFLSPTRQPLLGDVKATPRVHQFNAQPIPSQRRRNGPMLFPSVIATKERPGSTFSPDGPGRVWRHGVGAWRERGNFHASRPPTLPEDCQGDLEIKAKLPVWVSLVYGDRVLQSRRISDLDEVLEFEVDQEALRREHGIVRFSVQGGTGRDDTAESFLEKRPSIRIDDVIPRWAGLEDHQVTLYDVAPGQRRIKLGSLSSGHEPVAFEVLVPAGGEVVAAPVVLRTARPFEVEVVDALGAPVTALVRALRDQDHGTHRSWTSVGFSPTNASGIARIANIAPGPVTLLVEVRKGRIRFSASLDTSEQQRFKLVLPETTEVRVQRSPLESSGRFDLIDSSGVTINSLGLLNGQFRVPRGSYRIRPASSAASLPLIVGEDPVYLRLEDYL